MGETRVDLLHLRTSARQHVFLTAFSASVC
jgi:hypothetical protein